MSWVTLLGVMLGAAAGFACCFTSCAGAACVHAIATANAPAVTNAVRIGLMSFLPEWMSRCSRVERALLPAFAAKRDPGPRACQGGSGGARDTGLADATSGAIPGSRLASRHRQARGPLRQPRDVGAVVAEIVLEPECERVRLADDAGADVVDG